MMQIVQNKQFHSQSGSEFDESSDMLTITINKSFINKIINLIN